MKNSVRFLPEWLRPFATGAVLIGVLIGSLGLANALVTSRRQPWLANDNLTGKLRLIRVGDLQLQLPEQFIPSDRIDHPGDSIDVSVWLSDKIASTRTLLVGGIRTYEPRAPLVALNQMLGQLVPEEIRTTLHQWQPAVNFRSRWLVGASYGGISQTPEGTLLNILAVLTEDGRRYWVIYMNHLIARPELVPKAIVINRQLMADILGRAIGENLRNAQQKDFFAVGLGAEAREDPENWLPDGLRARVTKDNQGRGPILLFPNNKLPRIQLLRLRGVIDAGSLQAQDSLAPTSLLTAQIKNALGRPPRDQELWSGQIDNTPVWRATMMAPNKSLVRQVWYARLGHGRGLLIEILSEPTALIPTTAWVVPLIQAAQAHLNEIQSIDSADSPLHGAIARGQTLAKRQITSAVQAAGGDRDYFLIMDDHQLAGAQMAQTFVTSQDHSLKLRGAARTIRSVGTNQFQVDELWHANVDGSQFSTTRQWTLSNPQKNDLDTKDATINTEQMQVANNRITFKRQSVDGQRDEQWSASIPDALVWPWAEESWPLELNQADDQAEALIWMTRSNHPPRPFWIRLLNHSTIESNPESSQHRPVHEMWIRPLMSLDTDRLTYDAQGKVMTYETSRLDGPMGGVRVTATRVDEQRAIAAYPILNSELEPWLQNGVSEP